MISVEARGRLGNHMFQFAFGLAAAARLGTDFAMNDELLRPLFRLGPWAAPLHRVGRGIRYRLRKQFSPFPPLKIDHAEEPREALRKLRDDVHYVGFFQSLDYFDEAATAVRVALEPRAEHTEAFRRRYAELAAAPYVCLHVRRTDYVDSGYDLPLSYYRTCLDLVNVAEGTPVVFVGDDLAEVAREFGDAPGMRFEHNDEIVDLQLIVNAAVAVTSNSSFGWWGSWLGAADRPVYAPTNWLGFREGRESPRRAIPSAWRQVPVEPDG